MKEALGLPNPECDLVSLLQVMAQELPVPQVLRISQIPGILPKVLVNLLPYCVRDSGRLPGRLSSCSPSTPRVLYVFTQFSIVVGECPRISATS